MDEAASSLRLAQESKPDELEALDREIVTLQVRSPSKATVQSKLWITDNRSPFVDRVGKSEERGRYI